MGREREPCFDINFPGRSQGISVIRREDQRANHRRFNTFKLILISIGLNYTNTKFIGAQV